MELSPGDWIGLIALTTSIVGAIIAAYVKLAKKLVRVEAHLEAQDGRVALFWSKDWPELQADISKLNDRVGEIEQDLAQLRGEWKAHVVPVPPPGPQAA